MSWGSERRCRWKSVTDSCLNKAEVGRNGVSKASGCHGGGISDMQGAAGMLSSWMQHRINRPSKVQTKLYLITQCHCHVKNYLSRASTDSLLQVIIILVFLSLSHTQSKHTKKTHKHTRSRLPWHWCVLKMVPIIAQPRKIVNNWDTLSALSHRQCTAGCCFQATWIHASY